MAATRIPFTKEQRESIAANPFTLSVNDYQVRFTLEFKRFLLAEREKHGTPYKEIFRKAGYDPDVFGAKRIDHTAQKIRKEAASPKGLHETAAKKPRSKDRQQMMAAIRDLQEEVLDLQQQIMFLKKTQMLQILDKEDDQHCTN